MNSQIVNINIDKKDKTNENIYIKAEQIKLNIDRLADLMRDTSIESNQIVLKISNMK